MKNKLIYCISSFLFLFTSSESFAMDDSGRVASTAQTPRRLFVKNIVFNSKIFSEEFKQKGVSSLSYFAKVTFLPMGTSYDGGKIGDCRIITIDGKTRIENNLTEKDKPQIYSFESPVSPKAMNRLIPLHRPQAGQEMTVVDDDGRFSYLALQDIEKLSSEEGAFLARYKELKEDYSHAVKFLKSMRKLADAYAYHDFLKTVGEISCADLKNFPNIYFGGISLEALPAEMTRINIQDVGNIGDGSDRKISPLAETKTLAEFEKIMCITDNIPAAAIYNIMAMMGEISNNIPAAVGQNKTKTMVQCSEDIPPAAIYNGTIRGGGAANPSTNTPLVECFFMPQQGGSTKRPIPGGKAFKTTSNLGEPGASSQSRHILTLEKTSGTTGKMNITYNLDQDVFSISHDFNVRTTQQKQGDFLAFDQTIEFPSLSSLNQETLSVSSGPIYCDVERSLSVKAEKILTNCIEGYLSSHAEKLFELAQYARLSK